MRMTPERGWRGKGGTEMQMERLASPASVRKIVVSAILLMAAAISLMGCTAKNGPPVPSGPSATATLAVSGIT